MTIRHTITRDADATIIDDDSGQWFAVWDTTEGFDPFTAAIKAEHASAAEEVWCEHFPERGEGESLAIFPCSLTVNFQLSWPDGEVV